MSESPHPTLASARRELAELSLNPPHDITAGPKGGDLYEWIATIEGPLDSPYAHGVFFLDIVFPGDYPFKPPRLIFRTRIYHCNIDSDGEMSLAIVGDQWSPAIGIVQVLMEVLSLLQRARPGIYDEIKSEDALMENIAHQYIADRKQHDMIAAEWTKRCVCQYTDVRFAN